MVVGNARVSWLSHTSTNTVFFPKCTTFLMCFSRDERQKYAGEKVHLDRVSNSQPPGHKSDTLTVEPPRQGTVERDFHKKPIEITTYFRR